jgi:hypothetical protein
VDGHPVVGTIYWHLIIVKHGEVRSGALILRRSRLEGDLALLGSDIDASALSPNADRG